MLGLAFYDGQNAESDSAFAYSPECVALDGLSMVSKSEYITTGNQKSSNSEHILLSPLRRSSNKHSMLVMSCTGLTILIYDFRLSANT